MMSDKKDQPSSRWLMIYFMVIDTDKHRDDEYEICASLEQAKKAAQRRLDAAKAYYSDAVVEIHPCNGTEGWWLSWQSECGSFQIIIREVEVPTVE